jgi:hypothetical protein
VSAVRKLLAGDGTEEELDEVLQSVKRSVPHPDVSDLIYYPRVPLSAEEIVEVALSYAPIAPPNSDHGN